LCKNLIECTKEDYVNPQNNLAISIIVITLLQNKLKLLFELDNFSVIICPEYIALKEALNRRLKLIHV